MEQSGGSPKTAIGEAVNKSCERCRRRKIKCDRRQPCMRCYKAKVECVISGTGEKQRPIPRSYVQALEEQVASLELLIRKLAAADAPQREAMLAKATLDSTTNLGNPIETQDETLDLKQDEEEIVLARARAGQLRKLRTGNASQFYGGTSLFQIRMTNEAGTTTELPQSHATSLGTFNDGVHSPPLYLETMSPAAGDFIYAPHDEISQSLMATFFKEQYPYTMCVYREFFLRDYDTGTGQYYSDLLLYAICAMGAIASDDPLRQNLSTTFSNQAQALLYPSLECPDLTTLQALILLGQLEIGQGKASKGWLFCGMAFRLAHEMGLHLDPNNWGEAKKPQIETEIQRRVYWAAFAADKQLSLYFGRPPALYPQESDVRNTIRIPYPPDWEGLLDTYIAKGISATAYEDGIALAGTFIYRVELCKIIHSMIADLFENRRANVDGAVLANTARQIHVSLTKWLSSLPGKLHWNQWTVGQLPACVLHLHMLFHTTMIILHRHPRHLLQNPERLPSEDSDICYDSSHAILRLIKTYSRYYRLQSLPLDFVHTLSTTASILLMKRVLCGGADDPDIAKSLDTILSAMEEIKDTWPCVREIRQSILQEIESLASITQPTEPVVDNQLMTDLAVPGTFWGDMDWYTGADLTSDIGLLITDDVLAGPFSWDDSVAD